MNAEDLLQSMLEIPSLSGEEERLARHLERAMAGMGFAARRDEAGNVIGDIGAGGGPTVMLLSHMDTVAPALPARRAGGRLYGRGAVDAKAPLAAMICAAAARPEFPGLIRVIGAVEEERLSRGGHHIARTLPPPDALVIGEPGGWDRVVLGYKGKIDLEYWAARPATHSTNPLPKASEAVVAFWQGLQEALGPERDHGAFGLPAATLRSISGNLTSGHADVDCRIPPGFDVPAFVTRLETLAAGGELKVTRAIPAVRASRADPVVRALSAAIRTHGGSPRPTLKTGTSDMNTVSERWSVPMAAYGPGDGSLDHSDEESIEIAEFLRGVAILTSALDQLAAGLTVSQA
ncbi:M20/M25/M40 family metallo-hydrolase [Actinomadura sp. DC4]|uniref:M20/M25/M40 family metallo-hydrolase n=1 Tax=Actinomadura sp. DC4 TaxID=3055069 RepID=UPI0025AFB002|nr:M20/M25/M40 family metallo-hydrolase [Actinomadura sp. DC4]MDN3356269.1 M20/M25/M40 family metallo-hydrolase [Actinomadura sp. DC4]